MADISYNAEVTADVLNDIAVDLGATTFSVFQNSTPYAVHQLNDITAALVSKGILLSDSGNMCEAVVQDNIVYIQPGTIVFGNGAKMKLAETVGIELINNTYIYALLNTDTNKSQLIASATEPTTGDFVMLAKVNTDGGITDLRVFSKASVALPTEVLSSAINVNVTEDMLKNNPQITVNMSGSSKLFIVREVIPENSIFAVFDKTTGMFSGYQASDKENITSHVLYNSDKLITYEFYSAGHSGTAYLQVRSVTDDIVVLDIVIDGRHVDYPKLYEHGFTIYVLGGVSE